MLTDREKKVAQVSAIHAEEIQRAHMDGMHMTAAAKFVEWSAYFEKLPEELKQLAVQSHYCQFDNQGEMI